MRLAAAVIVPLLAIASAEAQTTPALLAPPVSSPPAPNPPPPLSPVLSNPALARSAPRPAPASPGAGPTPLDQQQMSAYRSLLQSEQRALEQQGISAGAPTYRDVQQQLNQLNGGGR